MPIRAGIIGAGWVSTARHFPSLARHKDVAVVSIFDRRMERAQKLAGLAGAAAYDNINTFLDSGLDLVSIGTPPWTHAPLAQEAFQRGVHVFTEKPMAMNEAEALSMVDAAGDADRLLCVSHNFLFSRSSRRADELLDRIGDVRHVLGLQLSSYARRLPDWYEQLPGGLLMDESPHILYTLNHFLESAELTSATGSFKGDSRKLSSASLEFQGSKGSGRVWMILDAPVSEWHIGIIGARGIIGLDLFRDIIVWLPSDGSHRSSDILKTSAKALIWHARGFIASGSRYVTKRLYWGHEIIIAKFVDAILGRGPNPVPPAEAAEIVRTTDRLLSLLGLS